MAAGEKRFAAAEVGVAIGSMGGKPKSAVLCAALAAASACCSALVLDDEPP